MVPVGWLGNVKLAGEKLMTVAAAVSAVACGLPAALSEIWMEADFAPRVLGLNRASMVQLAPAAFHAGFHLPEKACPCSGNRATLKIR